MKQFWADDNICQIHEAQQLQTGDIMVINTLTLGAYKKIRKSQAVAVLKYQTRQFVSLMLRAEPHYSLNS